MCTMTMTREMGSRNTNRTAAARDVRQRGELSPAQRRKVRRVREAIQSAQYENELKLEVTVDRLLERLRSDG